jgi:hypothetical protein
VPLSASRPDTDRTANDVHGLDAQAREVREQDGENIGDEHPA